MERIFRPKIFSVIEQNYLKDLFTKDLFAPVISIVALSLAVALAVVFGVSPDKGFATAVVAGFIISSMGGSRV